MPLFRFPALFTVNIFQATVTKTVRRFDCTSNSCRNNRTGYFLDEKAGSSDKCVKKSIRQLTSQTEKQSVFSNFYASMTDDRYQTCSLLFNLDLHFDRII